MSELGFSVSEGASMSVASSNNTLGFGISENSQPGNQLIKVLGIGGAGCNAVNHMIQSGIAGVDFIVANTDRQALEQSLAPTKIALGTTGLGAGARPDAGKEATEKSKEEIKKAIEGAKILFITAGMGGGTGTGGAPCIAEIANELGILTIAIVTKPFKFEGKKRMQVAVEGVKELSEHARSIIVVLNEKLEETLDGNLPFEDCLKEADKVLYNACAGIAEIINSGGYINVDFQDVLTIMSEFGKAMLGTAEARGENRAEDAINQAISSNLLEDVDIRGAFGVIVNITAANPTRAEVSKINNLVSEMVSEDATIINGVNYDASMGDRLRVTVIATGLGSKPNLQVVKDEEDESALNQVNQVTQVSGTGTDGIALFRPENPNSTASISIRRGSRIANPLSSTSDNRDVPAYLRRQNN